MKKYEFYLNTPEFAGPIDLLLSLIQEKEIDAQGISIVSILEQYLAEAFDSIDIGAEFIFSASSLLFFKSRSLLPEEEGEEKGVAHNTQYAIKALIEYVKFKKAGEALCLKDKELSTTFPRGVSVNSERIKPLGLEYLSLDDLSVLFNDLIKRKAADTQIIFEEEWRVSDKIIVIKQELSKNKTIAFNGLFLETQSKMEWIVIFLAILELMKLGVISAKIPLVTQNLSQEGGQRGDHIYIELRADHD